jgi:hypothetical protein
MSRNVEISTFCRSSISISNYLDVFWRKTLKVPGFVQYGSPNFLALAHHSIILAYLSTGGGQSTKALDIASRSPSIIQCLITVLDYIFSRQLRLQVAHCHSIFLVADFSIFARSGLYNCQYLVLAPIFSNDRRIPSSIFSSFLH